MTFFRKSKKTMNFVPLLAGDDARRGFPGGIYSLIPAAIAALIIIAGCVMFGYLRYLQGEVLNSASGTAAQLYFGEWLEYGEENAQLSGELDEFMEFFSAQEAAPAIDKALFDGINETAGRDVSLFAYTYDAVTRSLEIRGDAENYGSALNFIARLRGLPFVEEIDFGGVFSYGEERGSGYNFSVVLMFGEGAK